MTVNSTWMTAVNVTKYQMSLLIFFQYNISTYSFEEDNYFYKTNKGKYHLCTACSLRQVHLSHHDFVLFCLYEYNIIACEVLKISLVESEGEE